VTVLEVVEEEEEEEVEDTATGMEDTEEEVEEDTGRETLDVTTVEKKDTSLETVRSQGRRDQEDASTVEKKAIGLLTVLREEAVVEAEEVEEEEATTIVPRASSVVRPDTCLGIVTNREASRAISVENKDTWQPTAQMQEKPLRTSATSVVQPNTNWPSVTRVRKWTAFPSRSVLSATKKDTWPGTALRSRMDPHPEVEEPAMDVATQATLSGTAQRRLQVRRRTVGLPLSSLFQDPYMMLLRVTYTVIIH